MIYFDFSYSIKNLLEQVFIHGITYFYLLSYKLNFTNKFTMDFGVY